MTPSLMIIGAGYLGRQVANEALKEGFSPIILLRRSPNEMEGTTSIKVDVSLPLTTVNLPETDYVIYAVSADDSSEEAYDKAYVLGLNNVIGKISTWSKKPILVYISSTSVYKEEHGGWVTEDAHLVEKPHPSAALVEGEKTLIQSGLPYVILRFSGIYGPGRFYFINRVLNGLEPLFEGEILYGNRIHVEDGARALLHVINRPICHQRIFNVTDDLPSDRNDIIKWLHQELKVMNPLQTIHDKNKLKVKNNKRCSNKALKDTGFHYHFPTFLQGIKHVIDKPAH